MFRLLFDSCLSFSTFSSYTIYWRFYNPSSFLTFSVAAVTFCKHAMPFAKTMSAGYVHAETGSACSGVVVAAGCYYATRIELACLPRYYLTQHPRLFIKDRDDVWSPSPFKDVYSLAFGYIVRPLSLSNKDRKQPWKTVFANANSRFNTVINNGKGTQLLAKRYQSREQELLRIVI